MERTPTPTPTNSNNGWRYVDSLFPLCYCSIISHIWYQSDCLALPCRCSICNKMCSKWVLIYTSNSWKFRSNLTIEITCENDFIVFCDFKCCFSHLEWRIWSACTNELNYMSVNWWKVANNLFMFKASKIKEKFFALLFYFSQNCRDLIWSNYVIQGKLLNSFWFL